MHYYVSCTRPIPRAGRGDMWLTIRRSHCKSPEGAQRTAAQPYGELGMDDVVWIPQFRRKLSLLRELLGDGECIIISPLFQVEKLLVARPETGRNLRNLHLALN